MGTILGDRPFTLIPQIGLSDSFTPEDGGWTSYERFPRQLADVNGDRRADIVGFGNRAVYVSLARADGTFNSSILARSDAFTVTDGNWASFNQHPRQLGDVNGDGLADIVGFQSSAVFVSLARGDGTFNPAQNVNLNNFTNTNGGWTSYNRFPRQLADVNGDGLADIVGFGEDDVFVSLAKGDGTFEAIKLALAGKFTVTDGWTSQNAFPRQLADINGDRRADIVGFGEDDVFVAFGRANGTFTTLRKALSNNFTINDGGWESYTLYPRQLADLNNDGRADIIAFSRNHVFVSYANSNGTFGAAQVGLLNTFTVDGGGWENYNLYPRQVSDVNGDRLADIVGFGNRNVFVALGTTNKNDVLVGTNGSDRIEGLTGNDVINGQGGDDILLGGSGNDSLTGGRGRDTLSGDNGNDRFIFNTNDVFNSSTVGVDSVLSFAKGFDRIVLDKTTFSALASTVGSGFSTPGEFAVVASGAAAAASAAKIAYISSTGALVYNQNGNAAGYGTGGRFATLNNLAPLAASDFQIVA